MKTESKHLPKVIEAVNIIRSAFKSNKYRVLCKLHDNWPKLMNGNERERERERFVARSHSHSCLCSVECITNFLLFRSMKSLNSGESAT